MKRQITILLGVILLMALVAIPAAAQDYPNPGTGSTITELANKTSTDATVRIMYYNQQGVSFGPVQDDVPGNGSLAIDPEDTPVQQGFNGAGVASSSEPLAAVVQTEWTGGSGDGIQIANYSGVSKGSSKICFPSLWKRDNTVDPGGNAIISSFAVQNTSASAVDVDIEYIGRDGVSQGTFGDTIPVGSQHTYDLAAPSATVPNVANNWAGSAVVTVDGAGEVAGVGVTSWASFDAQTSRSATYNAADCSGAASGQTVLVAPRAYRVQNPWRIWSAVNIQNLSDNTATVQIEFVPLNPANPSLTLNGSIPPKSTLGANTRNGGNFAASDFNPLNTQDLWSGAVKITVSDPAVATVITQWDRAGFQEGGMYAAADMSQGSETLYVPNVKRVASSSEYSAILVQNLGGGSANINVAFYDRQGNNPLSFTDSIPVGAGRGYNTFNGGDKPISEFNPLGTSYEGHVVVTSTNGQPLAVVLNGLPGSGHAGSATTNGIP